tara:strand:+ start:137 stop:346 length:210 start_codon:yes stop_codon:yes gene_type:complete
MSILVDHILTADCAKVLDGADTHVTVEVTENPHVEWGQMVLLGERFKRKLVELPSIIRTFTGAKNEETL